jgi:hypothetical protein
MTYVDTIVIFLQQVFSPVKSLLKFGVAGGGGDWTLDCGNLNWRKCRRDY